MEKRVPRVLLVDDQKLIEHFLNVILPPAGYTVYQVRNWKEAPRRIQPVRPDLILLDPGLPGIDGKEVIREAAPP
jgi:DNA-binding response OmpR family regulator